MLYRVIGIIKNIMIFLILSSSFYLVLYLCKLYVNNNDPYAPPSDGAIKVIAPERSKEVGFFDRIKLFFLMGE